MPGVPSSRGCDGCRKQKKKCITVKVTSPCSRCHRLGLTCVGFGKQRFKFVDDEKKTLVVRNVWSTGDNSQASDSPKESVVIGSPSYDLANRLTRLGAAFVYNIDASADIKIQLPWNFGDFLSDVPRRLGTNEALDTASEALVTAYTHFIAGDTVVAPEVLIKHSNALNALRRCLNDPIKAYSSETLCSTMVLMIVQTLIPGFKDVGSRSHSVGAAQVLKGRGYTGPKDDFESKLLLSLRGPVAVEALVNSKVSLTQQQWKDLVYNKIDIDTIDGHMMKCLAHLPDLMVRGRNALKSPILPASVLHDIQKEARTLHDSFAPVLVSLRERWENTDLAMAMQYGGLIHQRGIIHAHFSRSYGIALAVGIALNCILAALDGHPTELSEESAQWSDETLHLAQVVDQYRPLGTIYMLLCLAIAWVGAGDQIKRAAIEFNLNDYQRDVQGREAKTTSADLEFIEARFYLK